MDSILHAIKEPRRRDILNLLSDRELASGEIADRFPDVTRPAVSQHLKVLLDAGLIAMRRDGTRRLYRARPEAIAEVKSYLDDFWAVGLRQLKQAAEADEQRKKQLAKSKPRRTRT